MALLVLCSVLSVLAEARTYSALPIALLAALALALERLGPARRRPVVAVLLEAALAGAAVALTGAGSSPMLPYLLAPGLALGLRGTWRQVLLASTASVAGLAAGRAADLLLHTGRASSSREFVVQAGQWVLLGLALGLIAGWAQRMTGDEPPSPAERYAEARSLLGQLRGVTRRLPGGLDVVSSGEALLERCAGVATSQRSAVLVQPVSGALVPVAVRGTRRVPWRAPLSEPGPLQRAWDAGEPVVDVREPDEHGRRRGSTLAVLPLRTPDGPFGLVVLESYEDGAFPPEVVARLQECVVEGALRLETALLFEEVRSTVMVEERGRLARDMHDGVAQELAFVGYELDALRSRAVKVDAGLAEQVAQVRRGLTRLISDIRLSITDLKTSVTSDRGLGTAISSYVRAVGSGNRVMVHLSLQEAAFRLPGEQEVLLFQIAQAVAQDVRRTGGTANLWVTLDVDPPSARLRVEHDGTVGEGLDGELAYLSSQLSRFGGTLSADRHQGTGVRVDAVLEGGDDDGPGAAGR